MAPTNNNISCTHFKQWKKDGCPDVRYSGSSTWGCPCNKEHDFTVNSYYYSDAMEALTGSIEGKVTDAAKTLSVALRIQSRHARMRSRNTPALTAEYVDSAVAKILQLLRDGNTEEAEAEQTALKNRNGAYAAGASRSTTPERTRHQPGTSASHASEAGTRRAHACAPGGFRSTTSDLVSNLKENMAKFGNLPENVRNALATLTEFVMDKEKEAADQKQIATLSGLSPKLLAQALALAEAKATKPEPQDDA
jgi:hypothetical protein